MTPIRIAVTGAAGQIVYSLVYRIAAGDVFGDRPVAVLGASPGGFGTILAQNAWLPVLRTLGCRHWAGGRLLVSRAGQAFDPDGTLQDEKVRGQLAAFVAAFAADIR